MSLQIPQLSFVTNPEGFRFGKYERKDQFKGLQRLIKDTKSYVFFPLDDEFEKQNQLRMIQSEANGLGADIEALYSEVSELRQNERKEMIKRGYLDDENSRRTLDNAISFRGTCVDMCPTFERIKRTRQNNVNINEKDPATNTITRQRAIKSFARPAAGQEPPLPSDVRPPIILVHTLNFIIDNLLDQMPETQSFIWDRTRSIRQDFTFQNYFGPETIECNEKIVRIHIMSLHIMANSNIEYSQQQELEQLEKSLKTLSELYDEYRKKGFPQPPNEAEFRAYHLLLKINVPDLERSCELLPAQIYENKLIQQALHFRKLFSPRRSQNAENFYSSFFDAVLNPEVSFLIGCLLEIKFNDIRLRALKTIVRANHTKTKALHLKHLYSVLKFPEYSNLIKFLQFYNIKFSTDSRGNESVDMTLAVSALFSQQTLTEANGAPKVMKSAYDSRLNAKMNGLSRSQIIYNGYQNNFQIPATEVERINALNIQRSSEVIPVEPKIKNDTLSITKPNKAPQTQVPVFGGSFSALVNGNSQNNSEQQQALEKQRKQEEEKQKLEAQRQQAERLKMEIRRKQEILKKQKEEEEARRRQQEEARRLEEERRRKEEEARKLLEAQKRREEEERLRRQRAEAERLEQERKRKNAELAKKKARAHELSEELFTSFLNEIVYNTTLEAIADNFRNSKLKLKAVKKVSQVSAKCKESYEKKQRTIDEFQRTQKVFGLVPNVGGYSKRFRILNDLRYNNGTLYNQVKEADLDPTNGNATTLKPTVNIEDDSSFKEEMESLYAESLNNSVQVISEGDKLLAYEKSREEKLKLWQPLDLSSLFLQPFLRNAAKSSQVPTIDASALIIVSDWEAVSSRWLKSKFGLIPDNALHTYSNTISSTNTTFKFTGFHEKVSQNAAFLFFECGFSDNHGNYTNEAAKSKLQDDSQNMLKFLSLVDSSTEYKYQIVILFWSDKNLGFSEKEVYDSLKIDEVKNKFRRNLINIRFCELNSRSHDIVAVDERLSTTLYKTAKHFKGELTAVGKEKQNKLFKAADNVYLGKKSTNNKTSLNGRTNMFERSLLKEEEKRLDEESAILQQHPYYKKYQHFNASFGNLETTQSNSFIGNRTILGSINGKRVASQDRSGILKKPRKKYQLQSSLAHTNNSVHDIPLAHSSMVQLPINTGLEGCNGNDTKKDFSKVIKKGGPFSLLLIGLKHRNFSLPIQKTTNNSFIAERKQPLGNLSFKEPSVITHLSNKGLSAELNNVPKNLLDLKNIISGIKSKYKK